MDLKVACMEARGFGPKRDTVAVLSVQLRVCYGARDNSVGMSNIFRLHRVGFSEANKTGGNCKIGGVGWRMIFAEECGSTTFIFHCADGASGPKQIGQLLLLEARAHAQGGIRKHVVTRASNEYSKNSNFEYELVNHCILEFEYEPDEF